MNNLGETLTVGDDPAERHVSFHGSPKSGLSLLREVIDLVDHNHLEGLLLLLVELLTSSNLLDQLLNNNLVVIIGLARRHLNMVV